jgi:hypothetical protein
VRQPGWKYSTASKQIVADEGISRVRVYGYFDASHTRKFDMQQCFFQGHAGNAARLVTPGDSVSAHYTPRPSALILRVPFRSVSRTGTRAKFVADSLFEAAVLGGQVLRKDGWIDGVIGGATKIDVEFASR